MTDRISLSKPEIEAAVMSVMVEQYRHQFGHAPRGVAYSQERVAAQKLAEAIWKKCGAK